MDDHSNSNVRLRSERLRNEVLAMGLVAAMLIGAFVAVTMPAAAAASPVITPAPGWTALPRADFYVNDTGTLWFSPWIQGTVTASIRVNLSDTVSGLENATATAQPSLAGGPYYMQPTNLGGAATVTGWTVSYAFNASSTNASSPVNITVCDEAASCTNASFAYALDATPPNVTILAPTEGQALYGPAIVAATATDNGSGIAGPLQVEILGHTDFMDMVWNGSAWVLPIQTALYADGSYRLVVRAVDNVGNEGLAVVDVVFDNAVPTPPVVVFVAPAANALVSGAVEVQVSVADAIGIENVTLAVGLTTMTMAWVGNDTYAVPVDTTSLSAGPETLSVTATDLAGLATTVTESIEVDNGPPVILLSTPSSDQGAIVLNATVTDIPAGVSTVVFIVDGKTYASVTNGHGVYSITLWTTTADNGVHSYEVRATDHAGNTATASGTFTVNNPTDYYAAFLAFAPLGIFVLLLVALILGIVLLMRRRRERKVAPIVIPPPPAAPTEPKQPGNEP